MAYQFFDCKMVDIKDENDVVKRFFIKVPDEIPFKHKAGQFIMLDLPIESKVTNRSYSIASAPSDDTRTGTHEKRKTARDMKRLRKR